MKGMIQNIHSKKLKMIFFFTKCITMKRMFARFAFSILLRKCWAKILLPQKGKRHKITSSKEEKWGWSGKEDDGKKMMKESIFHFEHWIIPDSADIQYYIAAFLVRFQENLHFSKVFTNIAICQMAVLTTCWLLKALSRSHFECETRKMQLSVNY